LHLSDKLLKGLPVPAGCLKVNLCESRLIVAVFNPMDFDPPMLGAVPDELKGSFVFFARVSEAHDSVRGEAHIVSL
jgi:hypothetical protein